ncbi:hypothetical protein CK203_079477 [Vitis vinifera]|uniref:Uncharacterized protein n=1 Tax=Vitis vinifera TaxID=29760 RepID=A0A438CNU9_VITVI|nr:hypothetical protein CK203_079477 [Vitis vinifera]
MTIHTERFWVSLGSIDQELYHLPSIKRHDELSRLFCEVLEAQMHSEKITSRLSVIRRLSFSVLFISCKETDEYGTFVEITDMIYESIPRDEYSDEILMMVKDIQLVPTPGLITVVAHDDDVFEGVVSPVVVESDHVDLPLSFDVLSGFVSRSDDIFDIDDEIVQHDSDEDCSSAYDSSPSDQEVSPTIRDAEIIDFDLNKASPKDDFPLPHIDMLVDSTIGHLMLSFMDGFSEYNQILMASEGMEKTFFITEWGYMVSKRGIEADPDKIRAILDMSASRTEREIIGFLGRLQYINRFIARLTDTFSYIALECMLAQLDDLGKERAIYYLSKRMIDYETRYVMIKCFCLALVWATRRLRHYMTEYSVHLISLLDPLIYLFDRPALIGQLMRWAIDDDFPYEDIATVTSLSGWRMYLMVHPATNNIVEYEACILGLETALKLEIRQLEVFGDSNLSRSVPAYCCLIDEAELDDGLPCYHDIYQFLRLAYILRSRLYRSSDEKVHVGVCGPHMGEHMLARKIMRTGYFLLTMETDCYRHYWEDFAKSSNSHEFILVTIDYFTKWVEAALYAILTSSRVASFIKSDIICRYGVPHELISNRGVHFRSHTYSLVYGMEVVLLVEIKMGSLRLALEHQISERKMTHAFKKRVKPRPLQRGDLVLKVISGLIRDPRGKFRPNWSGPYFIRGVDPKGHYMVNGSRWKSILGANQCRSAEEVLCLRPWS